MSNHVVWPMTALPYLVAGPVAAKALHRSICVVGFALDARLPKSLPSRPVGCASSAPSSVIISGQTLMATISVRSRGRPSNFAPASAAPSAIPFISSSNSGSNFRRNRASAMLPHQVPALRRRRAGLLCREAFDVILDFAPQELSLLPAAFVRLALDVHDDPSRLRVAIRRPFALDGSRVRREFRCGSFALRIAHDITAGRLSRIDAWESPVVRPPPPRRAPPVYSLWSLGVSRKTLENPIGEGPPW